MLLYLFVCVFSSIQCWDLSGVGLENSVINNVVLVRFRAFLSVPRTSNEQSGTLLEASWPERLDRSVVYYPKSETQTVGNCSQVQSAVCADYDSRGKLYVLDAGYNNCQPKVVVYDVRRNAMVSFTVLTGVSPVKLHSIVVDPATPHGTRAYIGDPGNGWLIIYNANDRHWWRVTLSPPAPSFEIAKTSTNLFMAGADTDQLFSIRLSEIRSLDSPAPVFCDNTNYNGTTLSTAIEGSKLGRSTALAAGLRSAVYYFLPLDFAIMRWDSRQSMKAENHDVLMQSADQLPKVNQMFTDTQNQLWALLESPNNDGKHCLLIKKRNLLTTYRMQQ